jgi:hypothetical protein
LKSSSICSSVANRPSRVLEASVNARKFFLRRMIFAGAELGIDLKRKLGEFSLSRFGPRLDPLQNVFEFLGGHGVCIAQKLAIGDSDVPLNSRSNAREQA